MNPVIGLDHLARTGYLAQQQPPPNAPEFGGSSPIGLVVILALFVVTFLLVRSMNSHLKKVPASFEDPAGDRPRDDTADDSADDSAVDSADDSGDPAAPEDGPKTTTAQ